MPLSFILFAPMSFCHLLKAIMAAHNLKTTTTKPNQNKKYKPPQTPPLLENMFSASLCFRPREPLSQTVPKGRARSETEDVRGVAGLEGGAPAPGDRVAMGERRPLGPQGPRLLLKQMKNLCFPGLRRVMQSKYSNQAAPGRSHHLPPALLPCYSLPPFLSHQGCREQGDGTPWP